MALTSLELQYFLDGMDLYKTFSLFVENGTDGFLQYPARKESITHDWIDSNGKDIDTTKVFFQSRTITLACAIVVRKVSAVTDFNEKYQALLALFAQPGTRRFMAARLGDKAYYVIYKDANNFKMYTPLKNNPDFVACKFNLVLEEPEPAINATVTAIVDHQGRILIT